MHARRKAHVVLRAARLPPVDRPHPFLRKRKGIPGIRTHLWENCHEMSGRRVHPAAWQRRERSGNDRRYIGGFTCMRWKETGEYIPLRRASPTRRRCGRCFVSATARRPSTTSASARISGIRTASKQDRTRSGETRKPARPLGSPVPTSTGRRPPRSECAYHTALRDETLATVT